MKVDMKLDRDAAVSLYEQMLRTMAHDMAKREAGGVDPGEAKVAEVFRDLLEKDPYLRLAITDPATGLLKFIPGVQLTKFDLEQIQDINEWLSDNYGDGKYSVGLMLNSKLKKCTKVADISGTGEEKWRTLFKKAPIIKHTDGEGGDTSMADKALEERMKSLEQELQQERAEKRRLETEFQRTKDANLEQSILSKMATIQAEQTRQMADLASKFTTAIESVKGATGGGSQNQIAEAIKTVLPMLVEAIKDKKSDDPVAMVSAVAKTLQDLAPKGGGMGEVISVIKSIGELSENLGLVPANKETLPPVPGQHGGSWIRDLSDLLGNFSKAVTSAKDAQATRPSPENGATDVTPPAGDPKRSDRVITHQEALSQGVNRLQAALKSKPDPEVVVEKLDEIVAYAKQYGVTHPWLTILETDPAQALLAAGGTIPELHGADGRNYINQIVAQYLYAHGLGKNPAADTPPAEP